ncbi:MAG: hypothetical protein ACLQVL_30130 [Terriglobia bacterium]
MGKPDLREIILDLVRVIERQYVENVHLKTILSRCPDAYTRQTWQPDLGKLVNDPQLNASSHAVFGQIYANLVGAAEDSDWSELLSKIPTGKAI